MNIWMWIAFFIFSCLGAWISRLNNLNPNWFWASCLISIVPVFPIIARFSKSLLIDGIIYDVVIFLAYLITLCILGCATKFTLVTWLGVLLTVIGVILMKV